MSAVVRRPIDRSWRAPRPSRASLSSRRERLASEDDVVPLSPLMKRAITALLITILFLPQFAVNLGGASLPWSLFATYAVLLAMLREDFLKLNLWNVAGVTMVFGAVIASTLANRGSSILSAALLFVIYIPFVFGNRFRSGQEAFVYTAKTYSDLFSIIAVISIVQVVLQFVTHASWITAARVIAPRILLQQGHFNTIAYSDGLFRSNGYFLLEPSSLSLYAAVALICEFTVLRRRRHIALHAVALVAALSGSGIFVLGIALVVPLLRRAPLRLLAGAGIGVVVVPVVANLVGLSSLVNRLGEFSRPGSSGYARFVAPVTFAIAGWERAPWSLILGNGPGSILRAIKMSNSLFEIFDPTWAKIIYEYGLIGCAAFSALFLAAFLGRAAPTGLKIGLFYAWLAAGGNLLSVDMIGLLLVLVVFWKADRPRAEETAS